MCLGYFMFNLLNDRISNSIVYLALLEVITVAWFYGVNRFMDNIGNNFLEVITVLWFYGVNTFMDNISWFWLIGSWITQVTTSKRLSPYHGSTVLIGSWITQVTTSQRLSPYHSYYGVKRFMDNIGNNFLEIITMILSTYLRNENREGLRQAKIHISANYFTVVTFRQKLFNICYVNSSIINGLNNNLLKPFLNQEQIFNHNRYIAKLLLLLINTQIFHTLFNLYF